MSEGNELLVQRHVQVGLDRDSLREIIGALMKPGAVQDWCVACGAGKSASPLERVGDPQLAVKELLGGRSFAEFVRELKDFGEQAWCVACGAGKSASPFDRLGNPADIADEDIDQLASRLISAIRIG